MYDYEHKTLVLLKHKTKGFIPSFFAFNIFYRTTMLNAIVFPVPDLKLAIVPKLYCNNNGIKTYYGSNGFSYPLQKIDETTLRSIRSCSIISSKLFNAIFYLSTL